MELNNESMDIIRKRIDETEADIDRLNSEIKDMADKRNSLETAYAAAKEEYENYKTYFTDKSSSGLYFLIVTAIVFVVILVQVLSNNIITFHIYPAAILFAAGIVLRVIGSVRFKKLKPVMEEKTKNYESSKEAYETFMAGYNATELELEKKQLQWELVENDLIEARKDAWVAQQKLAGAAE